MPEKSKPVTVVFGRAKLTKSKTMARYKQGAFGSFDHKGLPRLQTGDCMEILLLDKLSRETGKYVFKHISGRYGYLDKKFEFVSLG